MSVCRGTGCLAKKVPHLPAMCLETMVGHRQVGRDAEALKKGDVELRDDAGDGGGLPNSACRLKSRRSDET